MVCIGHSWEGGLGELEFPRKDHMVCIGHSWQCELREFQSSTGRITWFV